MAHPPPHHEGPDMTTPSTTLEISRLIAAPRSKVWQAWAEPHKLEQWWCPAPWRLTINHFGFVAGGAFDSTMHGPAGEEMAARGCFLLVDPQRQIVFTSLMAEGFTPVETDFAMTVRISLAEQASGTLYTATVMHRTPAETQAHVEMGFHEGWGAALAQLAALVE
jgi:uncharacterized protein YndB with AHSA1/START domain